MTIKNRAPTRENLDHYHEWLFLRTLDDIAERATPAWGGGWDGQDHYALLGLAPLLRKLLLEQRSLMQVMRFKRPGIPVTFPVAPKDERTVSRQLLNPHAVLTIHFTNASLYTENGAECVALKAFLKVPIGVANEHIITVADLIRYYAHVEGGVHVGDPTNEHQVLLATMGAHASTGGTSWAFLLAEISRSVISGLKPLRDAIEAAPTPAFNANYARARDEIKAKARNRPIGRTSATHSVVMNTFEASIFGQRDFDE